MNRAIPLAISHLLALGLGYGGHRAWSGNDWQSHAAPSAAAKPESAPGAKTPPLRTAAAAGGQQWSATDCRLAWRALPHSDLPPRELLALRDQLIRQWASRDLRAALIAWSDANSPTFDLGPRFGKLVIGREEEMLDWIKSGDFGADGPEYLRMLLSETKDRNPDLLHQLRPKLPAGVRDGNGHQMVEID